MSSLLQTVHSLDLRIYYFLGRFAGNGVICRFARLEEEDNLLKGGIFFAMFWRHWFRDDAHQAERRRTIITILIGAVLAIVATRAVAFIVPFSIRPMNDPTIVHPVYPIPFVFNLEQWSSFPSDTAAYFFALTFGLAYLSRRIAIPIMLYTAGWICLTRMFLGIHYASDIVVGAAIGVAMVWISIRSNLIKSLVAQPAVNAMERGLQWSYGFAFLVSFEMATVFEGSRSLGNAVVHAIAAGFHFRTLGTNARSPIGAWGGLLALAAFLVIVIYVLPKLSRKIRGIRQNHS